MDKQRFRGGTVHASRENGKRLEDKKAGVHDIKRHWVDVRRR